MAPAHMAPAYMIERSPWRRARAAGEPAARRAISAAAERRAWIG
jgi:hypothetical protein